MITRMVNSIVEALENKKQLEAEEWNVEIYATGIFTNRKSFKVEYLDRELVKKFDSLGGVDVIAVSRKRNLSVFTGYAVFVVIGK